MASRLLIKLYRGTALQNDAYTGSVGEVTVDTDNQQLRLHDGTTAGGFPIPNTTDVLTPLEIQNLITGDVDTLEQDIITQLAGKANLNGSLTEHFAANTLTVNQILPNGTTVDIGSTTARFRSIYVDEAHLSTNTLYIGDTPIMGTDQDTVNIQADPGQTINLKTQGSGRTVVTSARGVDISTNALNADVQLDAIGSGGKVRLGANQGIDLTAPTTTVYGDLTVSTDLQVGADVTITGSLTVNGTQTVVNSETVTVSDNLMHLNYGETGSGVTSQFSGIEVDRGNLSSYQFVFDEVDDLFKVGVVGDLEVLASREWVGQFYSGVNHGHAAATTTASGFLSAADKEKLNGVEAGATGDQTDAEILTAIKNVDGSASGLDADLLDGLHASAFATVSHDHSVTDISGLQTTLDDKVDVVTGKGLSTEDYTSAEKTKLLGIDPGAEVNVATNLGKSVSTTNVTITSSTGSNVAIGTVSGTNAGVMTAADKTKLDTVESGAQANVGDTFNVAGTYAALRAQGTTAGDVGLGAVNNTSDLDKPISTATQTALDDKVDKVTGKGLSSEDFTGVLKGKLDGIEAGAEANAVDSVAGKTGIVTLTSGDVGLGSVDNTSDAAKPVSTAQQSALDAKLAIADVVDGLTSTAASKALSANQGRILKGHVDNINSLLNSTDPALDTLQEIVDYVQLNRADLDALNIGAIAGLQTALDGKVDTVAGKGLSTEDYTSGEKTKLAGIAAGAEVNVGTDLSVGGSGNTLTVVSSTGSNASLPTATASNAGLMATGDKSKLDGIAAGAEVNVGTDLSHTRDGSTVTVASSTGGNTTLASATGSNAGVLSAADKAKLDGIAAGAQVNVGDTFDSAGTYAALRAQGTTAADVGLGNLPNATTDSRTSASTTTLLQAKALNDHRTSGDHDARYAQLSGATFTGDISSPEGRFGGVSDDGLNTLQVAGGARVDTLGVGTITDPTESIDTDGNARIRGEGQLQMGDFAIQYNAATQSLDFNYIGA